MNHILIIEARFYEDIADMLLNGAVQELEEQGASFDIVTVPGAFEIPAALAMAIKTDRYNGFVVLGCVIRGETSHYDFVCNESIHGVNKLAIKYHLAVGNGILTTENEQQAIERADIVRKNKGKAAASAALHMIKLKNYLYERESEIASECEIK
jgi:6,7-dimethyl-8-ribityllumazine synthase